MLIVGIDLETTGLEQKEGHRIIEVAAVFYDEFGTKKGEWLQRINPQRPIDPGAQLVHGISFEELADKPTIEEVAPNLIKVLSAASLLVAHNGIGFDFPFIDAELIRIGRAPVVRPVIDTMVEARWATPLGKLPNLGELCFACGVDYDRGLAHSALYDTQVMMESFFAGVRAGFFKIPTPEPETIAA